MACKDREVDQYWEEWTRANGLEKLCEGLQKLATQQRQRLDGLSNMLCSLSALAEKKGLKLPPDIAKWYKEHKAKDAAAAKKAAAEKLPEEALGQAMAETARKVKAALAKLTPEERKLLKFEKA